MKLLEKVTYVHFNNTPSSTHKQAHTGYMHTHNLLALHSSRGLITVVRGLQTQHFVTSTVSAALLGIMDSVHTELFLPAIMI